jgi:hypothetical protein
VLLAVLCALLMGPVAVVVRRLAPAPSPAAARQEDGALAEGTTGLVVLLRA